MLQQKNKTHALINLFKTKSAIRKNNTCINSFIQNKKCDKKNNTNNMYIH